MSAWFIKVSHSAARLLLWSGAHLLVTIAQLSESKTLLATKARFLVAGPRPALALA